MRFKELLLEYNPNKVIQTFGMKLYQRWASEDYPNEGQIHSLADKISKIPSPATTESLIPGLVKYFENWDPSPTNEYTEWMIRTYVKGGINYLEDLSRAQIALEWFSKLKKKRSIQIERDINKYKTLPELEDVVEKYEDEAESREVEKKGYEQRLYDSGQAKLIYNSDQTKIVQLNSEEASCYFGKNTRWCTASSRGQNYFQSYANRGDLYIILIKKKNTRYQLLIGENRLGQPMVEFRDEHDMAVNFKQIMNVDGVPEFLMKYGSTVPEIVGSLIAYTSQVPDEMIHRFLDFIKKGQDGRKQIHDKILFDIMEKYPEFANDLFSGLSDSSIVNSVMNVKNIDDRYLKRFLELVEKFRTTSGESLSGRFSYSIMNNSILFKAMKKFPEHKETFFKAITPSGIATAVAKKKKPEKLFMDRFLELISKGKVSDDKIYEVIQTHPSLKEKLIPFFKSAKFRGALQNKIIQIPIADRTIRSAPGYETIPKEAFEGNDLWGQRKNNLIKNMEFIESKIPINWTKFYGWHTWLSRDQEFVFCYLLEGKTKKGDTVGIAYDIGQSPSSRPLASHYYLTFEVKGKVNKIKFNEISRYLSIQTPLSELFSLFWKRNAKSK